MLTGLVALLLLSLCPLGSQPGPSTPEVFGPGVLSVGEVFRGSFTPDGNVFYFFKKIGSGEDYRIYSSNRAATGWTTPAIVDLGGEFSDLYPSVSRDGRRIVFSSYRPVPGRAGWQTNMRISGTRTARTADGARRCSWPGRARWGTTTPGSSSASTTRSIFGGRHRTGRAPKRCEPGGPAANTPRRSRTATSNDGKAWRPDVNVVGGSPGPGGRLVFLDVATRNPRTGRAASDIWVSIKRGDGWTEPAPLGAGVNSTATTYFRSSRRMATTCSSSGTSRRSIACRWPMRWRR